MNQEKENNDEIDLSNSLKDSSLDLEKEEDYLNAPFVPRTPKTVQWIIKYSGGLVKDEKQATGVVLGFFILATIISLFLVFGRGSRDNSQEGYTLPAESPAEGDISSAF